MRSAAAKGHAPEPLPLRDGGRLGLPVHPVRLQAGLVRTGQGTVRTVLDKKSNEAQQLCARAPDGRPSTESFGPGEEANRAEALRSVTEANVSALRDALGPFGSAEPE
jgi:hypothetical protein